MLKELWQNWANKRFKFEDKKTFSQRDILVFIYQQGYLYLVLILITFVAGVNYANNLILGFCFLISAILCISFYLTFKQLHGLSIELVFPNAGQVGQSIELEIFFQQKDKQSRYLWIKTDNHLQKILVHDLKHKVNLSFYVEDRGKFNFPNIEIFSVYPFGLVRAWTSLYLNQIVWIAPKAMNYQAESKQNNLSFEPDVDEFRELRNYIHGDSLQAVSWKQVARGQGLYIKVFEQHEDQQSIHIHYDHMPASHHEGKLSLMMGLVEQCEYQQCAYSLFLPHSELSKGCGEKQLLKAKLLLAQA